MSDAAPAIEPGKRVTLVGRTGSGKTTLGKWLMLRAPLRWAILDTKHDSSFAEWRPAAGLQSMRAIKRAWRERQMVVIRPAPHEMHPRTLDAYLGELHDAFDTFGTMVDEVYQFSSSQFPGPGLTGLVTRGRDRRQAVIMGSQRPARVPLFIYSESDHLAIMALSLPADRKRVFEFAGGRPEVMAKMEPRYWWWFDVATERLRLYGPVSINPT